MEKHLHVRKRSLNRRSESGDRFQRSELKVAGKGVQMLREAGVTVVEDFMREECDQLNPVFFHYITTKTPTW